MPPTFPDEKDLANPKTKELLEKYLKRSPDIPIDEQIKFWLSFIDFALSGSSGWNRSPSPPSMILNQRKIS